MLTQNHWRGFKEQNILIVSCHRFYQLFQSRCDLITEGIRTDKWC